MSHHFGKRYAVYGSEGIVDHYYLCMVNGYPDGSVDAALINPESGNRWRNPTRIEIKSTKSEIPDDQFCQIAGIDDHLSDYLFVQV